MCSCCRRTQRSTECLGNGETSEPWPDKISHHAGKPKQAAAAEPPLPVPEHPPPTRISCRLFALSSLSLPHVHLPEGCLLMPKWASGTIPRCFIRPFFPPCYIPSFHKNVPYSVVSFGFVYDGALADRVKTRAVFLTSPFSFCP